MHDSNTVERLPHGILGSLNRPVKYAKNVELPELLKFRFQVLRPLDANHMNVANGPCNILKLAHKLGVMYDTYPGVASMREYFRS